MFCHDLRSVSFHCVSSFTVSKSPLSHILQLKTNTDHLIVADFSGKVSGVEKFLWLGIPGLTCCATFRVGYVDKFSVVRISSLCIGALVGLPQYSIVNLKAADADSIIIFPFHHYITQ